MKYRVTKALLRPINPALIMVLGLFTIVWGTWLAVPFWNVFTTAAVYSQMSALAPEYVWGIIAIISGLFTLRGALKPNYSNLRTGSAIGTIHWFVIGVMYFLGNPASTAGITALCFSVYAFLVWLNVRVNKDLYERLVD